MVRVVTANVSQRRTRNNYQSDFAMRCYVGVGRESASTRLARNLC